ncbi:PAN domain-containing protein, partial [Klebsiella pneumoniae]
CLSVCQKDLSCVAFNYYKQNKMCRLFKYTDQYFRDDSVDAGVKTQTN